jgi:hypothetical protein
MGAASVMTTIQATLLQNETVEVSPCVQVKDEPQTPQLDILEPETTPPRPLTVGVGDDCMDETRGKYREGDCVTY